MVENGGRLGENRRRGCWARLVGEAGGQGQWERPVGTCDGKDHLAKVNVVLLAETGK